ncbi:putrescine-ornithine antiporter [Paraburkholderia hospita]|uniref:putrescine-ornithine antiporter n=1 Tax=Paraburkholderia hospita TaxID=169430 RepID=UPI0002717163|nr:putrescine-ornithine antiporter [Paraburkholderia hospita]EUC12441.1 ABC-type transporter, periplasmic subunit family 3 [Burkholderia sp. BT03]SKC49762.1 putrescine:ornithine antiporter [Paraburkholderia hospita]
MNDQPKKMNVVQLTFIVTVNMMGSGIIMLPTNMAKVGAISLLSWIVTAVGSMAIAYGFAQAGILNQRAGGMAAYAEDAYGRAGYFQVFFLYFLSVAIANVAVASSALGYLAAFFPPLTSSPIATCVGVIVLLWITTVANFGGPKLTGRIGSVTVWGVILPVGFISIAGWFWFHPSIFAAAWNPKGMGLLEGMGSSIALTLWAFLGMESAVQNSSAVENPKRDVPLACLFGTLGAAAVYVLSTTAIQGIVPNADLAKSTGPFGLAFAHMFTPVVGSIVMALAAMACIGSLLGWQFTLAQTAKDAADSGMFPAVFGKANRMGAPIPGMIIMGIVQSLMALSTISPNLAEQFAALVNLAVVTNVLPYIISLSALFFMMREAKTEPSAYRRNGVVTVIAMAYSIYALYASGKDAVLGGMLVLAIGYVIYGFIAARTAARAAKAGKPAIAAAGIIVFVILCAPSPRPAHAAAAGAAAPVATTGALVRIRQSGKMNIGYVADARPYVFQDSAGSADGYVATLCKKIADKVKADLSLPALAVNWTPVKPEDGYRAVQDHRVDMLCGDAETLTGRQYISYSIPVYPGGVAALTRADASPGLKEVLSGVTRSDRPIWRASPAQLLNSQTFSTVANSPTQRWLAERMGRFELTAHVITASSYEDGVRQVLDRKANVFFAERAILQDQVSRNPAGDNLQVLQRRFSYAPISIGVAREDEDLRLLADRTLSRIFTSGDYKAIYTKWFGQPDEDALNFYRLAVLPE